MKATATCQTTILVIDHEASVLEQMAQILGGAGYCCWCARDTQAAAALMRQTGPDLIISDINLSGHSGLTICEQLKQQTGMNQVPVMFLSGVQVPDIIRRSHAVGGTYYLRKPFEALVLLELIENVLAPSVPAPQLANVQITSAQLAHH